MARVARLGALVAALGALLGAGPCDPEQACQDSWGMACADVQRVLFLGDSNTSGVCFQPPGDPTPCPPRWTDQFDSGVHPDWQVENRAIAGSGLLTHPWFPWSEATTLEAWLDAPGFTPAGFCFTMMGGNDAAPSPETPAAWRAALDAHLDLLATRCAVVILMPPVLLNSGSPFSSQLAVLNYAEEARDACEQRADVICGPDVAVEITESAGHIHALDPHLTPAGHDAMATLMIDFFLTEAGPALQEAAQ